MTTADLAQLCAEEIVTRLEARGYLINPPASVPIARDYVLGCLNRALDEQTRAVQEVVHVHGGPGAVDVTITKSTQGVSLAVDCKRPREPVESWDQAAEASALLAARAYQQAERAIGLIGLTPGKEQKG